MIGRNLRAGIFNAVIPEIRKRGDAYYLSNFEPEATDMVGDSLAELITRAHSTNGGQQRIEVHAWIVTYNIWNNPTNRPPRPITLTTCMRQSAAHLSMDVQRQQFAERNQ